MYGEKMSDSMFKKFINILDYIGRLDTIISAISMSAVVVITIWGVFTRYVVNSPSAWTEELSFCLFVWLTFFGISILARRNEIVAIEFLLNMFPRKLRLLFQKFIIPVFTIAALGAIIYLGFNLVVFSYSRLTPILRIPFSYIYLGMPLGATFTLYHVIRCIFSGPKYYEKVD